MEVTLILIEGTLLPRMLEYTVTGFKVYQYNQTGYALL